VLAFKFGVVNDAPLPSEPVPFALAYQLYVPADPEAVSCVLEEEQMLVFPVITGEAKGLIETTTGVVADVHEGDPD
jgi:hypothetical protein